MNATRLGLYAAAVGLALAVLPAARLSAQDGQLAYHDSLPSFSRADLRATLRRAVAAPASTGELLRAGFAAFRLYELDREKVLADSAKKLFEGALAREPGSAWAHYGLGLVLSRGPGIRVSSPGRVLDGVVTAQVFAELFGVDPRARALRELRTALQIDPVLVPALLEMADHALRNELRKRCTRRAMRCSRQRSGFPAVASGWHSAEWSQRSALRTVRRTPLSGSCAPIRRTRSRSTHTRVRCLRRRGKWKRESTRIYGDYPMPTRVRWTFISMICGRY